MKKKGVYTAKECGGLKECIGTELPITDKAFIALVQSGLYDFYAYDPRIDADRYLIRDIPGNLGLPQWINDYEKRGLMRK